jgi:hypothetical protein
MTSAPDTRRLTVAQAVVTFLSRQYSVADGQRRRLVPRHPGGSVRPGDHHRPAGRVRDRPGQSAVVRLIPSPLNPAMRTTDDGYAQPGMGYGGPGRASRGGGLLSGREPQAVADPACAPTALRRHTHD